MSPFFARRERRDSPTPRRQSRLCGGILLFCLTIP